MSVKNQIEVGCSLSWFKNWSPEQRKEFGKLWVRLKDPGIQYHDVDMDDLVMAMNKMSAGPHEGPSVFECQLKIFEKWHQKWTDSDKDNFLQQLNVSDPDFVSYINSLSSGLHIFVG